MGLFQQIADALTQSGVRAILVGGHAVNHYGYGRVTMDVDLMIVQDDNGPAVEALERLGFSEVDRTELFARLHHADPAVPDVDLLLVDARTFAKVQADAKRIRLEDRDYQVPSIDVLIAMKLHALRYGEHRMLKDGTDIVRLLVAAGRTPDDITDLATKYGSEHVMKEIRFLYECDRQSGSTPTDPA